MFGRPVKLLPNYCAVSEPFICRPISPVALRSQFPNCPEALIYLVEDGGLGDVGKLLGRRPE